MDDRIDVLRQCIESSREFIAEFERIAALPVNAHNPKCLKLEIKSHRKAIERWEKELLELQSQV